MADVPCGSCHACCGGDVILLMPDQGDDVASFEHEIFSGHPVVRKGSDGNCIYLGSYGCTIHDRAPAICRKFDCRRMFLQTSRSDRRRMVKDGIADKAVFEAGRARLDTLGPLDV